MRSADVIVIGAGPAGSSAARAAAAGGASTLLLDRADFPRYKTCGGGIVGISAGLLPFDIGAAERDRAHRLTVTDAGRRAYTRASRDAESLFSLVRREDLDAALADAAVAAGAELRTGVAVTGLAESGVAGSAVAELGEAVTVSLRDAEPVTARVVVGADGAGGRTGRYVGVHCDQIDVGLEAEVPVPAGQAGYWRGRVALDWGAVPGSYGWVFPKGDLLTVGVIGARLRGEDVRSYYRDFCQRLGVDRAAAVHDSGHLTRVRAADSPLRRGRVLVAGDAAGLLEPWTREGISYALRSGLLAGRAAAEAVRAADSGDGGAGEVERSLAAYPIEVERLLGAEMAAGRRFHAAFSRSRWAFHGALALPFCWPLFGRIVAGETSLAELARRRAVRAALRALGG